MEAAKRPAYVSENESGTSDESDYSSGDKHSNSSTDYVSSRRTRATRTPKCFSKNALNARENRLKKKMYLENLEKDVSSYRRDKRKLESIIENQSFIISELKKEVKYIKSVLANSSDISKLIKNIHQSTGMSVSSSLGVNLKLNDCVPRVQPQSSEFPHPWEENNLALGNTYDDDVSFDDMFETNTFSFGSYSEDNGLSTMSIVSAEHDYSSTTSLEDDPGVCLHVSKNRVSLECCPSCNENAKSCR